jgi:signal transduction histidine kinase
VRDITERMHWEKRLFAYQAQLRSLATELSRTEERERRRIASVLHDQIGQNLVALKRKLELLSKDITLSKKNTGILDEILGLTTQTIRDTSSMTLQLSPPILYELGFVPAVEWLLEQFQQQNLFTYTLKDDGQFKPLNDDIKSLLFQSVRELLININKHAQAKSVKVSIGRRGSFFKISVEDDGVGFTPSKDGLNKDGSGGFGLFNIRERLNFIGGGFTIKSAPGEGSLITMTVPLALEHIINMDHTNDS